MRLPAAMNEKAQLIVKLPARGGEPMVYQCSLCGQIFPLPEGRTPKEAMAEVRMAFRQHVREMTTPLGVTALYGPEAKR